MAARNICRTCKFWVPASLTEGMCNCSNFIYQKTLYVPCPMGGLVYWDWDQNRAGFRTSDTFGCVNHKRNENAKS